MVVKHYALDVDRQTGESLTLIGRDSRGLRMGETVYTLYSPFKGLILRVAITDRVNRQFVAW